MDELINDLQGLADRVRNLESPEFIKVHVGDVWKIHQQNYLKDTIFPLPLAPSTLRKRRAPPQPSYLLRTGVLVDRLTGGFLPGPASARVGLVNPPEYAQRAEQRLQNVFGVSMLADTEGYGDALEQRFVEELGLE